MITAARTTDIQRVETPNGAEAWLVEETAVPVIAVEIAFRGGSAQDPQDRPGLVNLMTALLDEGAGDMTADAFQERLEELAIELSFSSNRDTVSASLRTLPENIDEAFRLLGLALTTPRFDEDAVERMRGQLSAQIRRNELDPDDLAGRTFFKEAFPGHPYGRPPRGTLESLKASTREDLLAIHRRVIARDNVVIGAVGAVSAERLSGLVDALLADLPATAGLETVETVAPAGAGRIEIVTLDVPQSSIIFGRPGPLRDADDFIPAYVVNHILGGGSFSSRLFTEVREKRGLAYSVYSYLSPYDHSGMLLGGVATRNDRAGQSIALIQDEIRRIAEEGPTAKELESAKKFLIGSYALRFDTSTKIANQLVQLQLDHLGIDYITKRNALVEAVTDEQVKAAAKSLFGDGDLLVVAVGKPTGLEGANTRDAAAA
ncbi:M16 family metallopeptidase [Chenggangzhangella methanolivorans]|uniref:Insulinase family protein n=1 Tax=Chenggangzhangella methanolivorans TaxID=1437009 RepID=A0A9E6UQV5_9HYPH|nr:pitrilysin family protein [Chenggangzhangella methanolivorans]QZO01550.1 insulinase family protein [Chenggangzhangella methanolivorans]